MGEASSARNSATSAADGSVPVMSRLTRRRNSASLVNCDGTMPSTQLGFWTRDRNTGTSLLETQFGIPQFQILVYVTNEKQKMLTRARE